MVRQQTLHPDYIAQEVKRALAARHRLIPWCEYTFHNYDSAPHLIHVAGVLERVERGEIRRLIITMPPRHGKTELVSVRFPSWLMCRKPDCKIIAAAYDGDLTKEMGRRTRNTIQEQDVFPLVSLAADSQAKDLWHTNEGGYYNAVSIGGGVTGWGADFIFIDDPIKSIQEAMSEVMRQHHYDWFKSDIITRQEPGCAIILVMHRWHEDDLAGRLEAEGGWTVINLPAIAEENDEMGRAEGTPLWESRFDLAELNERQHDMTDRDWNARYQQRPVPADGIVFTSFPTYERLPKLIAIDIPIDTAYTDTTRSDYTAWAAWGFDGSRVYLMEADRFRGEIPQAEARVLMFYNKYRQLYPNVPVTGLHRSSAGLDKIAAQHLRVGVTAEGIRTAEEGGSAAKGVPPLFRVGMPVQEIKLPNMHGSRKGRETLAQIVSVEFSGGRALVPSSAGWLEPWMTEHKGFPAALHDDWVETTILVLHKRFSRTAYVAPTLAGGGQLYARRA